MKLTIWVLERQDYKSLTSFFSFNFLSTESTAVNIQEMADRITELEVQSCDDAFAVKL